MSRSIEDYALIGNLCTTALVDRGGSIDWLCIPRFDSGACFASILGDDSNGRWLLAPQGGIQKIRRRYRDHTLLLETEIAIEFRTPLELRSEDYTTFAEFNLA